MKCPYCRSKSLDISQERIVRDGFYYNGYNIIVYCNDCVKHFFFMLTFGNVKIMAEIEELINKEQGDISLKLYTRPINYNFDYDFSVRCSECFWHVNHSEAIFYFDSFFCNPECHIDYMIKHEAIKIRNPEICKTW